MKKTALKGSLFVMHGEAYLAARTDGGLRKRLGRWTVGARAAFVVLYPAMTVATFRAAPYFFEEVLGNPLTWILVLVLLGLIGYISIVVRGRLFARTLPASGGTIAASFGLFGLSLCNRSRATTGPPYGPEFVWMEGETPWREREGICWMAGGVFSSDKALGRSVLGRSSRNEQGDIVTFGFSVLARSC